jgi:hypothetical protein
MVQNRVFAETRRAFTRICRMNARFLIGIARNDSALKFLTNKTLLPRALSASFVTSKPTTAAAAAMFGARTRFVNGERTTFEILAVKGRDRCLGLGVGRHFDKSETSGPSGEFVFDDRYRRDLSVGLKKLPNVALAGVERQITNIDVHVRHLS